MPFVSSIDNENIYYEVLGNSDISLVFVIRACLNAAMRDPSILECVDYELSYTISSNVGSLYFGKWVPRNWINSYCTK